MRELQKLNTPQTKIAEALGVSQSTVSKWLAEMADTTEDATEYLRSKALHMAENVVSNGQARDHIAVLKGLKVLADDMSQVQLAVGLSLHGLGQPSEGEQKA
jgi:predicted transcriptional regulator